MEFRLICFDLPYLPQRILRQGPPDDDAEPLHLERRVQRHRRGRPGSLSLRRGLLVDGPAGSDGYGWRTGDGLLCWVEDLDCDCCEALGGLDYWRWTIPPPPTLID